ncbi:hypothetical protein AAHC03_04499 [Spirometra sp. Aus1]
MFRFLYTFVIIHILCGCPKTITLIHNKISDVDARTTNSTFLRASWKSFHMLGKISLSTQSVDTVYTGLVSANAPSLVQPRDNARSVSNKTAVAQFFIELVISMLITLPFGAVILFPTTWLLVHFIHQQLEIKPSLTNSKKPLIAVD